MKARHIAFVAVMLTLVFLAHAAGRFTQIGGAQVAASIAIYILLALLIAPELSWGPLVGVGLAVGVLTMLATSSPFPQSNMVGHPLGFLLASFLTRHWTGDREANVAQIIAIAAATMLLSWTLDALSKWLALGTAFTTQTFSAFNVNFGRGFFAWWAYGFARVALPSFILAAILTPLLYRVMRPAMIRQGIITAKK